MLPPETLRLLIAALGGAAIGVERQWSGHADGPHPHFGGIRTFTLLGLIGGLGGWLWTLSAWWLAVMLVAGAIMVVITGYVRVSAVDVDGTTEVAALVVIAAGALSGLGQVQVASAVVAVSSLLLVEKTRLHGWVRRIADMDLRAAARFAVMALVVLPLLPEGPFGPLGGVRPRELWALVLFFSGLSFLGHLLRKAVGPGQGYLLSGAAGGLLSSTNVTWTFGRLSRTDPGLSRALGFGAVAANAVLYPRVLAATAVLNTPLVPVLARYLVAPAAVATLVAVAGVIAARRDVPAGSHAAETSNPLALGSALQMAVLFQAVLMLVHLARVTQGASGVFASAAVLGLTDVDALTLSMARDVARSISLETAATAIAIGVLANTLLKTAIATVFGSMPFRVIAAGALVAMAVASGVSLSWLR
ncbi:hypothetical protein LuPra_05795 [Luteitalea pratensis]|uniref:Uncharacterized protein n=1 Tax=Luteitalea pratensis TaxID=1855912 RepID=A0A143PXK1_LUTPR|nr:DUF4010 domain-containing protein [Luteitalea pratensis]AMY12519.1 hypothetical protein LuPra_05795 [Luteitalea pratensis]